MRSGILNAIKAPTTQEVNDLLKSIDPYSPDVILRDALARFVLINDNFTVQQPPFLTGPTAAGAAGGNPLSGNPASALGFTPMPQTGMMNPMGGMAGAGGVGVGVTPLMLNAATAIR